MVMVVVMVMVMVVVMVVVARLGFGERSALDEQIQGQFATNLELDALELIVAIALIRGKAERSAPVEESTAATTAGGELATGELAIERA